MKIKCHCGNSISDDTDFLSYKAHIFSDQDFEDLLESTDYHKFSEFGRCGYQCTECGRLYLDHPDGTMRSFIPAGNADRIFSSIKGSLWRAPLIGIWKEGATKEIPPEGYIFSAAEGGIYQEYTNWEEMKSDYYEIFNRLKSLNILRSSYLKKHYDDVHIWSFREDA